MRSEQESKERYFLLEFGVSKRAELYSPNNKCKRQSIKSHQWVLIFKECKDSPGKTDKLMNLHLQHMV